MGTCWEDSGSLDESEALKSDEFLDTLLPATICEPIRMIWGELIFRWTLGNGFSSLSNLLRTLCQRDLMLSKRDAGLQSLDRGKVQNERYLQFSRFLWP